MKISLTYIEEDEGKSEATFLKTHYEPELIEILTYIQSDVDLSNMTVNYIIEDTKNQNLIKTKYPELIL